MARSIIMKNPVTGVTKYGYYGFSWTTLFFGSFPALFRRDFVTFIGFFAIVFIISLFTAFVLTPFFSLIWAFMYNKYYTYNLITKGFAFAASARENEHALTRLFLSKTGQNCLTADEI